MGLLEGTVIDTTWAGCCDTSLHLAGGEVIREHMDSHLPSDPQYCLLRLSTRKPLRVKAFPSTLSISHNNRGEHSSSCTPATEYLIIPEQGTIALGTQITDYRWLWPLSQVPGQCSFPAS